jgi:hypothetical protein
MISEKPIVTMNTLGEMGRFGNQFFQYAFLKIYAKKYNLEVMTSKWIGQYLYGHNDPTPTHQFKTINEYDHPLFKNIFSYEKPPFENVNFWGFFQFHTNAYAPYKDYFRSLFQPVDGVKAIMEKGETILRSKGKTIVALHLRRGDYKGYGNVEGLSKIFYPAPTNWYKDWLKNIWTTLDNPVLFVASDELVDVLDDFKEYNPVTSKDLYDNFSPADYYPDFFILSKSDIIAISNSSFSFAASMLNENCKGFYRADYNHKGVIPYDPWSSQVLVNRHLIEPY